MQFRIPARLYQRFGWQLALIAVFLIPLKLAFAYAVLVPLITLWLLQLRWRKFTLPALLTPLLCFFAVALLSSLFGIEPVRSILKFGSPVFFAFGIAVYAEQMRKHGIEKLLFAALGGQTLTAFYTVLSQGISPAWPRIFLGQVTESGQLAVQIPVALGFAFFYAHTACGGVEKKLSPLFFCPATALLGLGAFILCTAFGFSSTFEFSPLVRCILGAAAAACLFCAVLRAREKESRAAVLLISIVLPLLTAALLINLKRGPWCGVFVGTAVFLSLYARALIAPLAAAVAAILIFVEPIHTRLALSAQHFFISGGRNVIWKIGAELATRFPLGIGYHNSPYLRNFSIEIPPQHNHFHNNLLNILVETGWFGLACYMWWLAAIFMRGFAHHAWTKTDLLSCALACSILSSQVAGIVEYNFGDSEVVQLILVMVGALVALREPILSVHGETGAKLTTVNSTALSCR